MSQVNKWIFLGKTGSISKSGSNRLQYITSTVESVLEKHPNLISKEREAKLGLAMSHRFWSICHLVSQGPFSTSTLSQESKHEEKVYLVFGTFSATIFLINS